MAYLESATALQFSDGSEESRKGAGKVPKLKTTAPTTSDPQHLESAEQRKLAWRFRAQICRAAAKEGDFDDFTGT
jgi:hypothetical protein